MVSSLGLLLPCLFPRFEAGRGSYLGLGLGLNPGLWHCRQTLYRLSHRGSCSPVGATKKEKRKQNPQGRPAPTTKGGGEKAACLLSETGSLKTELLP